MSVKLTLIIIFLSVFAIEPSAQEITFIGYLCRDKSENVYLVASELSKTIFYDRYRIAGNVPAKMRATAQAIEWKNSYDVAPDTFRVIAAVRCELQDRNQITITRLLWIRQKRQWLQEFEFDRKRMMANIAKAGQQERKGVFPRALLYYKTAFASFDRYRVSDYFQAHINGQRGKSFLGITMELNEQFSQFAIYYRRYRALKDLVFATDAEQKTIAAQELMESHRRMLNTWMDYHSLRESSPNREVQAILVYEREFFSDLAFLKRGGQLSGKQLEWYADICDRRLLEQVETATKKDRKKLLAALLISDYSDFTLRKVLGTLAKIGDPGDYKQVITAFAHMSQGHALSLARTGAAVCIELSKSEYSLEETLKLAKSPNLGQCVLALEILAQMKDRKSLRFLRHLVNDREPEIVVRALRILGEMKDRQAVGRIQKCLASQNSRVRMAAINSLGELKARSAMPLLIYQLGEENDRNAAINALGKIGNASDGGILLPLLDSPDPTLALSSLKILAKWKHPAVPPSLAAFIQNTGDWRIEQSYLKLLVALAKAYNDDFSQLDTIIEFVERLTPSMVERPQIPSMPMLLPEEERNYVVCVMPELRLCYQLVEAKTAGLDMKTPRVPGSSSKEPSIRRLDLYDSGDPAKMQEFVELKSKTLRWLRLLK